MTKLATTMTINRQVTLSIGGKTATLVDATCSVTGDCLLQVVDGKYADGTRQALQTPGCETVAKAYDFALANALKAGAVIVADEELVTSC